MCVPIHISIDSVMNVAEIPPTMEPSNWQNATGTLSSLSLNPSFSNSTGLTKHLVHPESRRATKLALRPVDWTISSMRTVIGVNIYQGVIVGVSIALFWVSAGLVRVLSPCLGNGVNSMTPHLTGSWRWLGSLFGGPQDCFLGQLVGPALRSFVLLLSALEASCASSLRVLGTCLCFWNFPLLREGFLPPSPWAMLVLGKVDFCFLSQDISAMESGGGHPWRCRCCRPHQLSCL